MAIIFMFGNAESTLLPSIRYFSRSSEPDSTSTSAVMPSDFCTSSSFAMATSTDSASLFMTSDAALPYFQRFLR